MWWRRTKKAQGSTIPVEERIQLKYNSFRTLLSYNNECLELMAELQEDLQYAPPRRDILDVRIPSVFEKVEGVVSSLQKLTGLPQPVLFSALAAQRNDIERYAATLQELVHPRLSASLHEIGADANSEAGGKAALLGEIRNKLGLPVPNGYVLTTAAYQQFCGIPLWTAIRDAFRDLDIADLEAVRAVSSHLTRMVMDCPVPRAIEVAITERAHGLLKTAAGLAVRSSAVGEGGITTYAGQFTSILNVPIEKLVDAYKQVIAGRFSDRAIFYRLSSGLLEVDTPMAVLFLPMIDARASGIMYTRAPDDPKSKDLWITATKGLGVDIASGRMPADLFVVSRGGGHAVTERSLAHKEQQITLEGSGGIAYTSLPADSADRPSLEPHQISQLAEYGLAIEAHFKTPQDIEWVLDAEGRLWILQSRPLALAEAARTRSKIRTKDTPRASGGRPVYPGRVSGPAFLLNETQKIDQVPDGAVVFVNRPAPEMVEVFPRIGGLVAEQGNVTGHVATLLREFRVPSVFLMTGALACFQPGEMVSFDAVQARVYGGSLWPQRKAGHRRIGLIARKRNDPISRRLLALNLLDPASDNFRPSACESSHDVLRYCHEKGIEAMFAVSDLVLESGLRCTKQLKTPIPVNVLVMDLGGGLGMARPDNKEVEPEEIISLPFRSLWKGMTHPGVSWTREGPARISDLASVLARSLAPHSDSRRALGDTSYLLASGTYMNLNARLAYHFSLVDACVSDVISENYITFRFEGGGTSGERRNLRARLIEKCLAHYGYHTDRRADLVNAWFRKAPAEVMGEKLDILGRLLGCTSQLDMLMTSHEVMNWYVQQFIAGNYSFQVRHEKPAAPAKGGSA